MKPTANDRRRPILHRGSDRRRREARNVKAEDLYRLRQITGCDVSTYRNYKGPFLRMDGW